MLRSCWNWHFSGTLHFCSISVFWFTDMVYRCGRERHCSKFWGACEIDSNSRACRTLHCVTVYHKGIPRGGIQVLCSVAVLNCILIQHEVFKLCRIAVDTLGCTLHYWAEVSRELPLPRRYNILCIDARYWFGQSCTVTNFASFHLSEVEVGCWIKYKLKFLISEVVDVGEHPTLWVVGFE